MNDRTTCMQTHGEHASWMPNLIAILWNNVCFKPGSYFLRMPMRSECWRHKNRNEYSQQFSSVQLTCEYRCERIVVTSNSRQICFAFAFAGSMTRALLGRKATFYEFGIGTFFEHGADVEGVLEQPFCTCLFFFSLLVSLLILALLLIYKYIAWFFKGTTAGHIW